MQILGGIPVSPGIAIGTAEIFGADDDVRVTRRQVRKSEVTQEIERWETGKVRAKAEIEQIKQRVKNVVVQDEVSLIFDSHLRILDDPVLDQEIRTSIEQDRYSAEYAVSTHFRKLINNIKALDDTFFGQRISDFRDIQHRLMLSISGVARSGSGKETARKAKVGEDGKPRKVISAAKSVVVAHDLTPSETATFPRGQVLAFVTDLGGATSHTAILANALGIPAVVGMGSITSAVQPGDTIIVDGSRGRVIISPDPDTTAKYERMAQEIRESERSLIESAGSLESRLADGTPLTYLANIEFDDEVEPALKLGAQGLGLFRTEFIYARHAKPTEEDHYQSVVRAMDALGGRPMTVRTLDFGADKFRAEVEMGGEDNPFLGYRSLRMCLREPDMFKPQVRALLRASARGQMRIMLPMVGSLDELRDAKKIFDQVKNDLRASRTAFDENIKIGVMIEVPSAALMVEKIAAECDFLSIGTNDLVQYTLAVDRNNPNVSHLYHHTHPAVLQLIARTIAAADARKIPVSVCGEMAGDPRLALLLVGLGLRMFSTTPTAIPGLKTAMSKLTLARCQETAAACMEFGTTREIDVLLTKVLEEALGGKKLGGRTMR